MVDTTLPPPSASPRSRDHIFISYAHDDRPTVENLAKDLRQRGYVVWIDFEGIQGGDVWRQSIADGLSASEVVLLAVTPSAVASPWVQAEIENAREARKRIIPLILRRMKPDDWATYESFGLSEPGREVQYIDFTASYAGGFEELLKPLPKPKAGIAGHCQKIIAELAALPWGLEHYIQEEARLLPVDASPYEDGTIKGAPENLLIRLKQADRILILGEPGMGKTVAFERLAWEMASADPLTIPITIKLFDYDGQSLLEWVRLALTKPGEIIGLDSVDRVRAWLNDAPYPAYFLLDGLNEVRPAHRETIVSEIKRLAMEFPKARLAVTSRVQDDSWRNLREGTVTWATYLIQPTRAEQIQTYLAAHIGPKDYQTLWAQLDVRMRELASTPLLLWLIKEAWKEAKAHAERSGGPIRVPDNRGALYSNFVSRMLRRDTARRLNEKLLETPRLEALEKLAIAMHNEQSRTIQQAAAVAIVGGPALIEALKVNGLLIGDSELRFAPHQTMQEHFAARAIRDSVMGAAKAGGVVRLARGLGVGRGDLNRANDPWWAETFIQLAGLVTDPNVLAQAVAEVNPWLAWWCVEEGAAVTEATRQAIEQKSMAMVNSPQVADRRRAVNALARLNSTRTLPSLVRLSLDTDPTVLRVALPALLAFGDAGEQALEKGHSQLPVKAKYAWWDNIAGFDPRSGVGLRPDGLPDIAWCKVPDDGEWVYQNGKHPGLPTFYIAKYPVTYAQFQAFIDASDGYRNAQWWAGLHEDGLKRQKSGPGKQRWPIANRPREDVSWYDALAFCRWLSAKLGYAIMLPTEEQWEKAARGTDGREYPYSGKFDPTKGNTEETGIGQTSAVGIFLEGASPYGVLDMSGNVWDWTLTEYESKNSNNVSDNQRRVVRGGSWYDHDVFARAAYRLDSNPGDRDFDLGFRLCCGAVPIT